MKGRRATGCTDFERGRRWLRREVLRVGVAGLSGVPLANAMAATPAVGVRAQPVLFFHHYGAPSHIDTFDPKTHAPAGQSVAVR